WKMGCGLRASEGMIARYNAPLPEGAQKVTKGKRKRGTNYAKGGGMSFLQSVKQKFDGFIALIAPNQMSENDLRSSLAESIRDEEPTFNYSGDIVGVYPTMSQVVYCLYESEGMEYWRASYKVDSNGQSFVDVNNAVECERIVTYPPLTGVDDDITAAVAKLAALAGARHSASDMKMVQSVHDTAVSLGADCASMTVSSKPCGCHGGETTQLVPAEW